MNTLIRYNNPSSTLLDNLLNWNNWSTLNNSISSARWPKVDITGNNDGYTIKADLPGIDKADVSIVIENGVLRIEGERKNEFIKEDNMYHHYERNSGKFSRSFSLPEEIDTEHVEATMSNGVLTVNLRKTEKAKPKTIEVRVE